MGPRQARAGGRRAPAFGKLLKAIRERRGKRFSTRHISDLITEGGEQLSHTAISRYESAERLPDAWSLRLLGSVYRKSWRGLTEALVTELAQPGISVERLRHIVEEFDDAAWSGPAITIDGEDFQGVTLMTDPIAAGDPLRIEGRDLEGEPLAFRKGWLRQLGIDQPLCVRVGDRELSMLGTINPGEIVLLDCAHGRTTQPKDDHIYAVNVDIGGGVVGSTLKRVIVVEDGILLVADNPNKELYPTRRLRFHEDTQDTEIQRVLVGEVMWKGGQSL